MQCPKTSWPQILGQSMHFIKQFGGIIEGLWPSSRRNAKLKDMDPVRLQYIIHIKPNVDPIILVVDSCSKNHGSGSRG